MKNEKTIKFESAVEMVKWLMDNEGIVLFDNYGREWKYINYIFYFKDLGDDFIKGLECLHLFQTGFYTIKHKK